MLLPVDRSIVVPMLEAGASISSKLDCLLKSVLNA